jgi:hypothetical protein
MTDFAKKDVEEIIALIGQIKPILAGKSSAIQGAVLAELTAIWVAGHYGEDDKDTAEIRSSLLTMLVKLILKLTALKDAAETKH